MQEYQCSSVCNSKTMLKIEGKLYLYQKPKESSSRVDVIRIRSNKNSLFPILRRSISQLTWIFSTIIYMKFLLNLTRGISPQASSVYLWTTTYTNDSEILNLISVYLIVATVSRRFVALILRKGWEDVKLYNIFWKYVREQVEHFMLARVHHFTTTGHMCIPQKPRDVSN